MRTFTKALGTFRKMVEERGQQLRELSFAELKALSPQPEHITVESRSATVGIIVLPTPRGGLQVVVQGFLKHRFFPGRSVALDGFYKYPDERIGPMLPAEFLGFD